MTSIMEIFKSAEKDYSKQWLYYNDAYEGDTSGALGYSEVVSMDDIDINEIKNLPDFITDKYGDEYEVDYNINEIENAKKIYVTCDGTKYKIMPAKV